MAIITTQSTTISDGTATGKLDLSVKYWKILQVLLSRKVALINATVENRDQVDAGTAYYYVTRRNITQDYLNGKGENDTTAARPVQVLLDRAKEINFEIETLDLKRLGAKLENGNIIVSDKLVANWIDAKAKSVEAYLVAKLLQLGTNAAKENAITTLTIPNEANLTSYRQNIWLPIVNKLAELKALVSSEYIGTDEEDYYLWVSPKFKNYILLATSNLGADSSAARLIDGVVTEIGGIKVVESTLIGSKFELGVIDKQEAFDFTIADAMLIHKQALAFPFNRGQENTFILQGNGNIKTFHKFLVSKDGGGVLRKELVAGFKVVDSPTQPPEKVNIDVDTSPFEFTTKEARNKKN